MREPVAKTSVLSKSKMSLKLLAQFHFSNKGGKKGCSRDFEEREPGPLSHAADSRLLETRLHDKQKLKVATLRLWVIEVKKT